MVYNVPGILADRVLLIGCGKEREIKDNAYRNIISHSMKQLIGTGITDAISFLPELNIKDRDWYWKIRQAIEAAESAIYEFT